MAVHLSTPDKESPPIPKKRMNEVKQNDMFQALADTNSRLRSN